MGKKEDKKKKSKAKSHEQFNKWSLITKIAISLFIAGAYVVGTSFYEGYMTGLGFHDNSFPLSIDEKYLHAYYALVLLLFETTEPLSEYFNALANLEVKGAIIVIFCAFIIQILHLTIKHDRKIKRWIAKLIKPYSKIKENKLTSFLKEIAVNLGIAYFILLTIVFYFAIVVYIASVHLIPLNVGIDAGLREKDEFQKVGNCTIKNSTGWNRCAEIINANGELIMRGMLVARNGITIGLLEETTSIARVYQLRATDEIRTIRTDRLSHIRNKKSK